MSEYDSIINIKSHEPSYKHPRMSIYKRSAQFAPFAALSGYSEQVNETQRLTTKEIELSEDKKEEINNNLIKLIENKDLKANITYFSKDKYKTGGKYINIKSSIKKIDNIKKLIILSDNSKINIKNIVDITIIKSD